MQKDFKRFLWKHVVIGIKHHYRDGLFYYSGQLVSANDDFVVIRKDPDKTLFMIQSDRILEIRVSFEQKQVDFRKTGRWTY
jgi:hypothetical protein